MCVCALSQCWLSAIQNSAKPRDNLAGGLDHSLSVLSTGRLYTAGGRARWTADVATDQNWFKFRQWPAEQSGQCLSFRQPEGIIYYTVSFTAANINN